MLKRATVAEVSRRVEEECGSFHVVYPLEIKKSDTQEEIEKKVKGAFARLSDPRWWRRYFRIKAGRHMETIIRELGFVQRGKSAYLSNWGLARWRAGQRRNADLLSSLDAENELGETVSLAECYKRSVSNPVVRRNELMPRMRGFEELATDMGYACLFFTLTCPSKYHAQLESGGRNAKFNGSTPREAIAYLNKVWSLIRAEWNRQGIKMFGFRVAEPHHDGTPHYHFLLFCHESECDSACNIFGRYALAEDGKEPGALEKRWTVKKIDPAKGSAAGYIAKYVAKNLDGYAVGVDDEAELLAREGADRARAWASLWGIRQFQQIGSVSVTVWRELRRRREALHEWEPDELEPLRQAADAGNWKLFVELMGGATASRKEMLCRPMYFETEAKESKYGEAVRRLIGVWLRPVGHAIARQMLSTREHVWKIRERGKINFGVPELEIKAFEYCRVAAAPPPLDLCQ
ncbi:replication endonuclease [Teredinibacter turnerae]|uniref:replication endonuclease n=1 Tax=Teredinibacter turnerae TaxID=2426 RepID=UPI0012F9D904|nr:replication endonuclease [Teredinibacter turnerae]